MDSKPTALYVFDFDGTLYNSPRGAGLDPTFYLHARSLDGYGPPGFDPRWQLDMVKLARRAKLDPRAKTLLVTARPHHNAMVTRVRAMLDEADLAFDGMHFKPLLPVRRADGYKADVVRVWVVRHPTIKKVVLYDDELENHQAVGEVVTRLRREFIPVLARGFE
jgi:hypothetical protein